MSLTTGPMGPAEPPAHPSDRVSDLIQKLVAAATAEVETAAQRARAQAEAEITELQRTLDRTREELQAERDRLTSMANELSASRAAAARLGEELNAERTEKARFAAAIETIRLVVSGVDAELHSVVPAPAATTVAEADDDGIDNEPGLDDRGESRDASIDDFAADDHLSQLLSQIEEIYRADLKSAEGTSELVARLAANLEYARDAYASRIESDIDSEESDDLAQFDRRLAALIDARSGTPFGRHLEMAIRHLGDRRTAMELEQRAS
jgi:Tfp pilus assembly protein FimV